MRIAISARKHGVSDHEIRHAVEHHVRRFRQDDSIWLYVGGTGRGATLIEVAVLRAQDGEDVAIHAMPVRSKFWP
ncbi:MAG: (2Fe-2S)-binding protein [Nocardioidaceae bacterium]